MDPANRDLLEDWIIRVGTRPGRHCGVFAGDDGQSFGHRARPWDYPDILLSGRTTDDSLELELSDGALRVDDVLSVTPDEHPWGQGLRVDGFVQGAPCEVWLV